MSCQHCHTMISYLTGRYYCVSCGMDVTGLERSRMDNGLQPKPKAATAPLTTSQIQGIAAGRKVKRENHE